MDFPRTAFVISALIGFFAVALGAFGAHALKDLLAANGTREIWEKAALYHLVHAVVLLVLASRPSLAVLSWWFLLFGVIIFSGSLYLLAATNVRWLGAVTPIGGLALLAGWLLLAVRAL
jgi:uncharacterized membrane protein YgdD (TMEM256/DUF423 family)